VKGSTYVGSTRRAIPNVRHPATDTEGLVKNTPPRFVLFQASSQNLSPYFGSAASIAGLALLQSAVGVVFPLRHGVVMPRTSSRAPTPAHEWLAYGWPVEFARFRTSGWGQPKYGRWSDPARVQARIVSPERG
jgi:hypothetical protein